MGGYAAFTAILILCQHFLLDDTLIWESHEKFRYMHMYCVTGTFGTKFNFVIWRIREKLPTTLRFHHCHCRRDFDLPDISSKNCTCKRQLINITCESTLNKLSELPA